MYSIVLAAALAAGGGQSTAWGCWSCHGCHSGWGWNFGVNFFGGFGRWGCHGCHGCHGCSGCYCSGCYCSGCYCSECYSCYCSGCHCSSYCSGCYCSGCHGCFSCYGCHGCHSTVIIHEPVVVYRPVVVSRPVVVEQPVVVQQPIVYQKPVVIKPQVTYQAPPQVVVPVPPTPVDPTLTPQSDAEKAAVQDLLQKMRHGYQPQNGYKSPYQSSPNLYVTSKKSAAAAKINVRLPADALLYVDEVFCPLTSSARSFSTPKLQPGQVYFYTLKAQFVRNGQTVNQTRRVLLTAGQQVSVSFGEVPQATPTVRR